MSLNAGTWEAQVGPFNGREVVNYYVSVTDNSGRRERSQVKTFTVQTGPDTTAPTWRGQGQSNATPAPGRVVQLYAQGMDEIALRSATLETDETGTWGPRATYGSPMDLGDVYNTWVTSSFTWNNPAVPGNSTVHWRIVYADATGNVTTTPEMAFTIQDVPVDTQAPQYSSPNVSSMIAGQPAQFSLRWTDNEGVGWVYL